jgi:alpha-glucosidase
MYYGEEIGMRTTVPTRIEDVKDPVGRTGWPKDKGRDGERTPMQWDKAPNAGFSSAAKTWLPVPPSAAQYNVAAEHYDSNSIFNFYKHLIALRREVSALRDGSYVSVNREDSNVLAYLRRAKSGTDPILVALNMSSQPQTVNFSLQGFGVGGKSLHVLMAAPQSDSSDLGMTGVKLEPFGVLVAAVE